MSLSIPYVAGLFDGEGYITVTYYRAESFKYTRCQIKAGIGLTYAPIIQQLCDQFGGLLNINDSAHKRSAKNRICYAWVIASIKAADFLRHVQPHLVIKREQCDLAIELQRHVTEHKHFMRYHSLTDMPRREGILQYREGLVAQIKALKKETFPLLVRGDPVFHA